MSKILLYREVGIIMTESTITKRVNERRENLQLSHIYTENIIKKFYI